MMKNLPGILFLIATPCSVALFVKVQEASGSDILGLLAAGRLLARPDPELRP